MQLDQLERDFCSFPVQPVEKYGDVQALWREMERRVTNRKPLTKAQRGGRVGRRNVRKVTDEEMWLREGLYDHDSGHEKNEK